MRWALSLSVALSACTSREPPPRAAPVMTAPPLTRGVLFGFTPAHGAAEAAAWGSRLAGYLSARIGSASRPFVASSYGTLVQGMIEGRVDLGWLPPLVYVVAAGRGQATPVVKFVRRGRGDYHAAFIVRADRRFRELSHLRGKRLAWTDPRSSSGYLFPRATLLRMGIEPDRFFSHQAFLGSHRRVVEAVLEGRADVGVTFHSPATAESATVNAWRQYFPKRAHELRIVALAGPIPSDVIAVRRNLSAELVTKVRDAFVNMHDDPAGRELLSRIFNAERAVPARPGEYAGVSRMAEELRLQ